MLHEEWLLKIYDGEAKIPFWSSKRMDEACICNELGKIRGGGETLITP